MQSHCSARLRSLLDDYQTAFSPARGASALSAARRRLPSARPPQPPPRAPRLAAAGVAQAGLDLTLHKEYACFRWVAQAGLDPTLHKECMFASAGLIQTR